MVRIRFFNKKKGIISRPAVHLPGGEYLTWAELFHGVITLGNAGSGKTSGPGAHILNGILRDEARPGGIALCIKQDERLRIERAISAAGREADKIVINAENIFKINALLYELTRKGRGAFEFNSVVDLLMELSQAANNYQAGGGSGGENERFWDNEVRVAYIRALMLLTLAGMTISIMNMRNIMMDNFGEAEFERYSSLWARIEASDEDAMMEYEAWCESNFFLHCFDKANSRDDLNTTELEIMKLVGDYYLKTFAKISEKTKAIVIASATGLFEPFLTGILHTHFDAELSDEVRPEKCFEEGRLIILDIPLKEYGISAIYAATIFKKLFQLCVERRVIELEENPRPVFLWCDEAHLFLNPQSDERFQSSCRSTMTAVVYLTQSINSIKSAMGKSSPEIKTKALLTNLGTQIFCGNMCTDTNKYASELIGKRFRRTEGNSISSDDRASHSTSEQLHFIVPPEHFTTLKSGGPENDFQVETIIVIRSKRWATGEPFGEVAFDQRGRGRTIFQKLKSFFS